jgi:hypothetical protein
MGPHLSGKQSGVVSAIFEVLCLLGTGGMRCIVPTAAGGVERWRFTRSQGDG